MSDKFRDDFNPIDIKLDNEPRRNNRKNPAKKPTSKKTASRPMQSKKKKKKKPSFLSKYSFHIFTAVIVIIIAVAIVFGFSKCCADNQNLSQTLATNDQAIGIESITITITGTDVFYNGTKIIGLENLKSKLETDMSSNATISVVHDGADTETYNNVQTIVEKVKSDKIGTTN